MQSRNGSKFAGCRRPRVRRPEWQLLGQRWGRVRPKAVLQPGELTAPKRTFRDPEVCGCCQPVEHPRPCRTGAGETRNSDGGEGKVGGGAPRVFISYASEDAAIAAALVEALERHGIACWIARRDVKAGALYADAIVPAINVAKAVIPVLSGSAIASSHVSKEIEPRLRPLRRWFPERQPVRRRWHIPSHVPTGFCSQQGSPWP